jgi:MFS transporter, DHA2 family, methylenomycin A resistance protein
MVILDTTVVNVALQPIAHSFGAGVSGLQWVVDSYAVVFASLLLAAGAISDRVGARPTLLSGMLLFTTASVLCGAAPTLWTLVAARVVQGVGAALLIPASIAAIRHAFPDPARRSWALGLWTTSGSSALAAGPVVGGLLVSWLGWRSVFWVNLPVGLVAAALARANIPAPDADHPDANSRTSFNVSANIAGALALATLSFGLIEGPPRGWSAAPVVASLTVAIVAATIFGMLERRHPQPLVPRHLWRHRPFVAATAIGWIANFAYYGLVFALGVVLERWRHLSPLATGLAFLPLTVSVMAANVFSGRWTARVGSRAPMAAGLLTASVGLLGLAAAGGAAPYPTLGVLLLLVGFGMGLTVPAMTALVLTAVPRADAGVAAGILNASRQIGGVVGVAILGALVSTSAALTSGLSTSGLIAGCGTALGCLLAITMTRAPAPVARTSLTPDAEHAELG